MKVTELAPAKLNLTLEVGEKRSDGYHEVQSVMSCAALYDEITLESGVGGGIVMDCDCGGLPCDETNLCVRAAQLFYAKTGVFCDGLHISLKKRIPMQAGLGGGSADAAAVLRGLRKLYRPEMMIKELERMAIDLGSDVPFCVRSVTAMVRVRPAGTGSRPGTTGSGSTRRCWGLTPRATAAPSGARRTRPDTRSATCRAPWTRFCTNSVARARMHSAVFCSPSRSSRAGSIRSGSSRGKERVSLLVRA